MSFGIIRMRKLTSAHEVKNTDIHNFRQYDKLGLETPPNITKPKYAQNVACFDDPNFSSSMELIREKLQNRGIKTRKNSVVALEYVVALSPDCKKIYEAGKRNPHALLTQLSDFIGRKHGWDNVIHVAQHFDESNPHVHIVVIPVVEKTLKWKNKNGEGTKKVQTLCADDFVGDKAMLRQLQTDFFEHVQSLESSLNSDLPQEEAITFRRGMDARNQPKKYTYQTNADLGELREQIRQAEKEEKSTRASIGRKTFERMNPFQEEKKPPVRKLNRDSNLKI